MSQFVCTLSGSSTCDAVVNAVNGRVYDRQRITAHIAATASDPVDGTPLSVSQLVSLHVDGANAHIAPTMPFANAMGALTSEFERLLLERTESARTASALRRELAVALYQLEAATRVIARLVKENAIVKAAADATAVTAHSLPADAASLIEATRERIGGAHRKALIKRETASAATADDIAAYRQHNVDASEALSVLRCALSPQSAFAVFALADGAIRVINVHTARTVAQTRYDQHNSSNVTALAITADESDIITIVAAADDGTLRAITCGQDGADAEAILTIQSAKRVVDLSIHPSNVIAAAAAADGSVSLVDLSRGAVIASIAAGTSSSPPSPLRLSFHPDGRLLALTSGDAAVSIIDSVTMAVGAVLRGGVATISIAFSPNGYVMASADAAGRILVWDIRKAPTTDADKSALIAELTTSLSAASLLQYDAAGLFLLAADSRELLVFDVKQRFRIVHTWNISGDERLAAASWSGSAKSIVAVTSSGRIIRIAKSTHQT